MDGAVVGVTVGTETPPSTAEPPHLHAALAEMKCWLEEALAKLARHNILSGAERESQEAPTDKKPQTRPTPTGAMTIRERRARGQYDWWVFPSGSLTSTQILSAGRDLARLSCGLRQEPTQSALIHKFVTALTNAHGGQRLADLLNAKVSHPYTDLHTLHDAVFFASEQATHIQEGRRADKQRGVKQGRRGSNKGGAKGGALKGGMEAGSGRCITHGRQGHTHSPNHSRADNDRHDKRSRSVSRGSGQVNTSPRGGRIKGAGGGNKIKRQRL